MASASVVNLGTTGCALLFQQTKSPSTNIQYTDVDLLPSAELAQSDNV
uniref:Uncharacterized protein n=1 Tax=Kalanchoe fedtschenkoi TaxID=63787 RepID=A0A7N0UY08_KALFE